jgi:hypothetical protein
LSFALNPTFRYEDVKAIAGSTIRHILRPKGRNQNDFTPMGRKNEEGDE